MGNIFLTSGNRITPNQLTFPAQCRRQVEGFSPKAAGLKQPYRSSRGRSSHHSSESQTWSSSLHRGPPPLLVLLGRHLRHHQERLPLAWAWSSAWPWGGTSPASAPPLWFGLRLGLRVRTARGPETAFSSSQLLQSRRPRTKESCMFSFNSSSKRFSKPRERAMKQIPT